MSPTTVLLTLTVFPLFCLPADQYDHILGNKRYLERNITRSLPVYKILQPPVQERSSRDLENVGDESQENVDRNETGHKSKSPAIPAISLIKDFFGNHENYQGLEDSAPPHTSHQDAEWIDEGSFSRLNYNNFSVSPSSLQLNSPIISPFLADPAESEDTEDDEGDGGEGQVSSDVYEAVHDVVARILSKKEIGAGLVNELKLLLGDY